MQRTSYRPIRDYRQLQISYYDAEDPLRPTVEELQKKYESFVERFKEKQISKRLQITKDRGDKKITKTLILSPSVSERLNTELPRIKKLAEEFNEFSAAQLAALLKVGGTTARKYINLLLATGVIKSNGSKWAVRYKWSEYKII